MQATGRADARRWWPLLPLVLVSVLATQRLERYPDPWYDEGINLQAARNLAQTGRYGLAYGDGIQVFDAQLTTGPTVIVPAALVFAAFGSGLAQGRAVMAVYTLVAALGLFWVGSQVYGPEVGALAVLVLAGTSDFLGPLETRSVIGEMAALAFLWWGAGVLVWSQATSRPHWLVVAGVLFGLATVTKAQFGLVLPALPLLWLLTRRSSSGLSWRMTLLLIVAAATPVLFWQAIQVVTLGVGGFLANAREAQGLARVSSMGPPLRQTGAALRLLLTSPSALIGVAALVSSWTRLRRVGALWPAALLLPAFTSLWLAWYLTVSMGWLRQAIPLVATCSLLVAVGVRDLLSFLYGRVATRWAATLVTLTLLAPFVLGVVRNGAALASANDTAASVAAMVEQDVPRGATIETYEWELDSLANRPTHHPPANVVADAVGSVELGEQPRLVEGYEPPPTLSFLIDGRFSKLDGIYRHELMAGEFRRITSAGAYDLYERATR